MAINLIYVLVFLIFSFLIYLIIKSLIRGVHGKNRKKFLKNNIKQY